VLYIIAIDRGLAGKAADKTRVGEIQMQKKKLQQIQQK
jgi:hypothetical protein